MNFINRHIAESIQIQRDKYPVIAVTGPRQSGKTTLLKTLFNDYEYISLEDPNNRAFAQDDPLGFLSRYGSRIILDEAQQAPILFSYIQTLVDISGKMGQFVLSGSQNFHLIKNITQSLAGRVALFKLLPFDFDEMKSDNLLAEDYLSACINGFYPAIYDRDINPSVFYANYMQTYVERDVTELVNIRDTRQFRTFLGLCAARVGQLLNLNSLANECGISQPTAKAWISILESRYILFRLQPFYQDFNKRVVKTSKLYFYDTGLLCHILGIRNAEALRESPLRGNIFENMVIAEYQKKNEHQYLHQEYWFWRDSNGHEVDMLTQNGNVFDIFEIKATQTIMTEHFKGMNFFSDIALNKVGKKTLIYGGNEDQQRSLYTVSGWRNI
ncbi:ATP-binding protein [Dyadobacter pollutisoli]|uniref:ATP-binding protein n=1 Tax=Dyadobacter pollutisoli TaxID=2910158 RepID=A0A9E8SJM7_9BACT|nr:ATP-binding protein [Dyadobacter pollutisoli]WAC11535.1 ATP-binding protein [Dyadobacter pollutisoli]